MTLLRAIACACGALALVLGCATDPILGRSAAVIFRVDPSQVREVELEQADCMQPVASIWEWQFVDESGRATPDQRVLTRVEATTLHGASLSAQSISGDLEYFERGADGTLALRVVDSPSDRARTFFVPPLAADLPQNASSAVRESACTMRVDWIDGRGERESGRGERVVRAVGSARVVTSQGMFETLVIESTFEASLRLAKVRRVVTTWVAPHAGCIAQQWDERVTVMGVALSRDCGMAVRVSPIATTLGASLP